MSSRPQHLPPGLTATVSDVEEELGRAVALVSGEATFDAVEGIRRCMVAFREADDAEERAAALDRAEAALGELDPDRLAEVARAYTLYLQLVNVCENAYRTHRLREQRPADRSGPCARITFVLTAHPTESRSPANIRLLRRVQDHVLASLEAGRAIDRREIGHLVRLAWNAGTHPKRKPSVGDEAAHLFSLLTDPILGEWIALVEAGHEVLLRSWVGGDKDGHPGVGPDQTQASLERSRERLLGFARGTLLPRVAEDSRLADAASERGGPAADGEGASSDGEGAASEGEGAGSDGEGPASDGEGAAADSPFARLDAALRDLERVSAGDGGRVAALRVAIEGFQSDWRERLGRSHPALDRLSTLLRVFPALVVPLELREERGRFGADTPIAGMMDRLARIAEGGSVDHYARAVVVSMTLEAGDLLEAQRLVDASFGTGGSPSDPGAAGPDPGAAASGIGASEPRGGLPVIPLFELPDVLERAPDILADAWRDDRFREAVRSRGHLEVMLGYSDTAKRMGMLASRVALHDAMRRIGEWAGNAGVEPLFFHGHGGSVGRGGGRIENLAATWPSDARALYKYTVQGEMVERTFASPAILRGLVEKVARVQSDPPEYAALAGLTRELARRSQEAFERRVASAPFRALLASATPYTRLEALTIGSRPTSRSGGGLDKLRAIPWVLCWTQTRLLLHAWLGIGQAWRDVREGPGVEEALADARTTDPLFRSYARLLSFTMAKTAPGIWRRYRERLATDLPADVAADLEADYEAAIDLACRAVGGDSLLPDRPWLEESIRYRAPMIHPLNLIQIDLLEKPEWNEQEVTLFRETVTGIAAGMLTTG